MSLIAENTAPQTVAAALDAAGDRLAAADTPRLDAELLLCHLLQRDRAWITTRPQHELPHAAVHEFFQLVARRASGLPLAYLTGTREFWSLNLSVNEHTLVPRPESELLVEHALRLARPHDCIIDAGTGSGAIALALASELPAAGITATDISAAALQVARANAAALQLDITFVQTDWLAGLAGADLIVCNPPYVAAGDPHLAADGVRAEPQLALVAGTDGLDAIRIIVPQAAARLRQGGWLLLEHGYDQADAVAGIMRAAGFENIATHRDLGGRQRLTLGQCSGVSADRC